jgi:predicted nucleic acid-binding protein
MYDLSACYQKDLKQSRQNYYVENTVSICVFFYIRVRRFPVRGNLVPDAHLTAILHQHGVQKIYTEDRDFLKFDFLDVRDPFV